MSINNEPKQIQMTAYIKLLEIYKAAETNNIARAQEQFQGLPATMREQIFGLVAQLAQSSITTDCQWDQTRVFEELPRLQKAIQTVAFNAFDSLAQGDKNYVAERVWWHYTGSYTIDPSRGKTLAKDPDQTLNLLLSLTENAHADPKMLAVAIFLLQNNNLITSENWQTLITHADPRSLALALIQLQKINILTPENRQAVCVHAKPTDLAYALHILQASNTLTPENKQATIAHAHPLNLARALIGLQRDGNILTPENRQAVCVHANPITLADALCVLQRSNILTPENRQAAIAHADPSALLRALYTLQHSNILTPENSQIIRTHANPTVLARALEVLRLNNILTPENRQAVCIHAEPADLAFALRDLQLANILTPENRQATTTHTDPRGLEAVLYRLQTINLLTQGNFEALLLRPILCTPEIGAGVWDRLPPHLLTQQVLQQIFTLSAGQNPIAHLTAYVDQLLNGPVAAQPALNGTQSTHTATVHASGSESAMKLMSKYKIKDLDETIGQLSAAINALPPNPRNEAAKRCLIRLTALGYTYVDPASGVSTKRLLALAYLANQEAKTDLQLLIDGLYECQRGYNLNANGEDTNPADPDLPICVAGTFNKIMEKLNGLDDAVSIVFITKGTAALKLQAAVRDYALKNNITDITDQNWPEIRNAIKSEMAPYRVAFASDAAFETFIDAGMYVDLTMASA